MKNKKIYISGKIRGLSNYREIFKNAENYLKKKGYVVINPAELPEGLNGQDYMNICIPMVQACDSIYICCLIGKIVKVLQ